MNDQPKPTTGEWTRDWVLRNISGLLPDQAVDKLINAHSAALAAAQRPLVDALRILLSSRGCWTGDQAEIPEEISAQFDINLDDARKIESALAKVKEGQS